MLNEKDIYNHLCNGGDISSLYEALENEIEAAQAKIDAEKIAEQEAAVKALAVEEARKTAVAALTEYFALVNPDVTENIISSVLSTLESVKIKTGKNGVSVWGGSSLSDWLEIFDIFTR